MIVRTLAAMLAAVLAAAAPVAAAEPPASSVLVAGFSGGKHAYACAVIIGADARSITLVTALHTLEMANPEFVLLTGERLRITASDPVAGHDMVALRADRPRTAFAVAPLATQVRDGAQLHVWGPIDTVPFTPHAGTVRPLDARITDAPAGAVAIDCAACDHGDSGTGAYDDAGNLVGIITRAYFAGATKILVLVERVGPDVVARAR